MGPYRPHRPHRPPESHSKCIHGVIIISINVNTPPHREYAPPRMEFGVYKRPRKARSRVNFVVSRGLVKISAMLSRVLI